MNGTKHCPSCGASKCHWKKPLRKLRGLLNGRQWNDDPKDANPVDGYRCPHCNVAIVDYSRFDIDEDDLFVSLFEYTPKYCMQCGKQLEVEE